MNINTLTTAYADIGRLLSAVETLCGTAPESLTAVPRAHQRLTTAAPVDNPLRALVAVALDDSSDDKAIAAQFETAALARLVGEQRRGSAQHIEAELLQEFCRRLEQGRVGRLAERETGGHHTRQGRRHSAAVRPERRLPARRRSTRHRPRP